MPFLSVSDIILGLLSKLSSVQVIWKFCTENSRIWILDGCKELGE
jgi:hypothetical protein